MTFTAYFLSQQYENLAELGDRLGEIEKMIDWEVFRPILSEIYQDDPLYGGRPHTDEVILLKLLILQQWYGLSDYELGLIKEKCGLVNFPYTTVAVIFGCWRALGPTSYLKQGWVREGMQSHPYMLISRYFKCEFRSSSCNIYPNVSGSPSHFKTLVYS
jgi:hypothetical protein